MVLIIILKGILFILGKDLLPYLSERNIGFILGIIMVNILLNKLYKYQRRHNNLTDHIIYYRFNSKTSLYYSLFIIITVFISYIIVIFYLRIINLEKPADLAQIYFNMEILYYKTNLFICIYVAVIILLLFYTLLKLILLIKKYLNIHNTKIHFYLLSYEKYNNIHNYIRDHLVIHSLLISRLKSVIHYCEIILCFGYYKSICYRYSSEFIKDKTNKMLFWTEKDVILYEEFQKRHENKMYVIYYLVDHITKGLHKLHIITLIFLFIYDIFYNDYILIITTRALPFLFIYQLYISLCYFITDKPTYDICELTNQFYYQDLIVLDEKTIILNGVISEMPTNFVEDFLKYDAKGFCHERNF